MVIVKKTTPRNLHQNTHTHTSQYLGGIIIKERIVGTAPIRDCVPAPLEPYMTSLAYDATTPTREWMRHAGTTGHAAPAHTPGSTTALHSLTHIRPNKNVFQLRTNHWARVGTSFNYLLKYTHLSFRFV